MCPTSIAKNAILHISLVAIGCKMFSIILEDTDRKMKQNINNTNTNNKNNKNNVNVFDYSKLIDPPYW
jgi:hypothetical protein